MVRLAPGPFVVAEAAQDGQPVGELSVQRAASRLAELALQHVAHQGVGELVAQRHTAQGAHDAGARRLVEVPDRVGSSRAQHLGDQGDLEALSGQRGHVERGAGEWPEARELALEELGQAPGQLTRDDLVALAGPQHLGDEEGVAPRDRPQRLDLGAVEVTALGHPGDEVRDLLGGEPAEGDLDVAHVVAVAIGEDARHLGVGPGVPGAQGEHDHQARGRGLAHHPVEQVEAGAVGPVQVVEDEEDGVATAQCLEPRAGGFEEPPPGRLWVGQGCVDGRREPTGEAGQDPTQFAADRAEQFDELIAGAVVDEVAERLGEGLVGRGDALVTASVEDDRPLVAGLEGQASQEGRLARAGLAGDDADPAPAGEGVRPRRAKSGELVAASHELVGPIGARERVGQPDEGAHGESEDEWTGHRGLGRRGDRDRGGLAGHDLRTSREGEGELADEDPAGPGGAAEPRGLVHRVAEHVTAGDVDLPDGHADADLHGDLRRHVASSQPMLELDGGLDGLTRGPEDREDAVTESLDHDAVVSREGASRQPVDLAVHRVGASVTEATAMFGGAHDVGKDERVEAESVLQVVAAPGSPGPA